MPILATFLTSAYAQTGDIGVAVYVDSVGVSTSTNMVMRPGLQAKSESVRQDSIDVYSREGKFRAVVIDPCGYRTDDVLRCVKMAMDNWESRLELSNVIRFSVELNEEIEPDVEIRTSVYYTLGDNGISMPLSLYYQPLGIESSAGTIEINPNALWDSSWANEIGPYGHDNLLTALQRHIGHVLGFGASVGCKDGTLDFATPKTATAFDNLLTNGQKTLGSMALSATNRELEDFLKCSLSLNIGNKSYPIYSSYEGYVPYRTGCYFMLPDVTMMNYPYANKTKLLPINNETLEVMDAIGWTTRPYDIRICATNLDIAGYGSMYLPHTFSAVDFNGNPISNVSWSYQLYNGDTGSYETIATGNAPAFTITPEDKGSVYVDGFSSQQARVVCNTVVDGTERQHVYPVYLEARPYLVGYEIYNVEDDPANGNYCTFDARLDYVGVSGGWLTVIDGNASEVYELDGENATEIHARVYKYDSAYLDVTLTNAYGTTDKSIYLNTFIDTLIGQHIDVQLVKDGKSTSIYTLQGVKISGADGIKALPAGIYVIVENTGVGTTSRKCVVK